MNKLVKLIPIMAGMLLIGCNSGGSNWHAGNLGILQIEIAPATFNVGESALIMATLSNAQQGTDAIGSATVYFKVANSYSNGIFESSSIATMEPESCVINNPISADVAGRSCFVTLHGVSTGSSHVYSWAIPNSSQNTTGPTNYNSLESYPFVSFSVTTQ